MGLKPTTLESLFWCSPDWAREPDTRMTKHSWCLHKKWHRSTQTCAWLLAAGKVPAPPEVTLYLSSTSSLAQCYLNFGILPSSVASLMMFPFLFLGGAPTSICHFFWLSSCLSVRPSVCLSHTMSRTSSSWFLEHICKMMIYRVF